MELINIFDIETSALPREYLDTIKPVFTANKTLKDPEKIKADLEAKEQAWRDNAALDATTGRVLCIGMASGLASADVCGDWADGVEAHREASIIERFWNWLELHLQRSEKCVGFAVFRFDLPFLVRRSWALGVDVPRIVRRGRQWHEDIIDLLDVWRMGNFDQMVSLDMLSRTLGFGGKSGDGANFGELWASDRKAAIEYVLHDLKLTRLAAERMLGLAAPRQMPQLKPIETKLAEIPKQ